MIILNLISLSRGAEDSFTCGASLNGAIGFHKVCYFLKAAL
jgi:hypothetical protein